MHGLYQPAKGGPSRVEDLAQGGDVHNKGIPFLCSKWFPLVLNALFKTLNSGFLKLPNWPDRRFGPSPFLGLSLTQILARAHDREPQNELPGAINAVQLDDEGQNRDHAERHMSHPKGGATACAHEQLEIVPGCEDRFKRRGHVVS
jgi:hypothetical protein